jgi:hypothetical protein
MSKEYVNCPFCPRHCITGVLALTEIPKDSQEFVPDSEGNDLRPFCKENYVKFETTP